MTLLPFHPACKRLASALGLLTLSLAACAGSDEPSFKRKDSAGVWQMVSDTVRTTLMANLAANQPLIKVLTPDAGATATLKTYSDQVAAEKAKPIGTTTEALCLVRVPGDSTNRSAGVAGCEASHTLARGSDSAQAVAEAFLFAAKRADFSLQNAGGVRTPIAAGSLNMNTAA